MSLIYGEGVNQHTMWCPLVGDRIKVLQYKQMNIDIQYYTQQTFGINAFFWCSIFELAPQNGNLANVPLGRAFCSATLKRVQVGLLMWT